MCSWIKKETRKNLNPKHRTLHNFGMISGVTQQNQVTDNEGWPHFCWARISFGFTCISMSVKKQQLNLPLSNNMVYPRRVIISSGNISFTEKSRSFFDGVSVSVGVLGFFLLEIFRITVHYTR